MSVYYTSKVFITIISREGNQLVLCTLHTSSYNTKISRKAGSLLELDYLIDLHRNLLTLTNYQYKGRHKVYEAVGRNITEIDINFKRYLVKQIKNC